MADHEEDYRALHLPDGYSVDRTSDPGRIIVRREDGSEVTRTSARWAVPAWIEKEAWEDRRRRPAGD